MDDGDPAGVDLLWLPLGAGGRSVRLNGRVYEAVAARLARRPPADIYHSALEIRLPEGRWVVEMAPAWRTDGGDRGVVASGPVGLRVAGRLTLFRYEVRLWRDGVIPDADEAVGPAVRVTADPGATRRVVAALPGVPAPVWGRDELRAGEMWNSNSVVAWVLERAGLDAARLRPPAGGRAPGWDAGVAVARRP